MIKVRITDDFDLGKIADSGQCFRWHPIGNDGYRIIHRDKCLCVWKADQYNYCEDFKEMFENDEIYCLNKDGLLVVDKVKDNSDVYVFDCNENDFINIWCDYLDMNETYSDIRSKIDISKDAFLHKASNCQKGIRILKQDPWEALISFIISQNRNIPAIKASIEKLSECAGIRKTDSRGEVYYTFPTAEAIANMSDEELVSCRLGYRDKYVKKTALSVVCGELDLEKIGDGTDEEVLSKLMSLYGVGKKVANCMLLFGLHHLDAFPIDVWIKRVIETEYEGGYPFDDYRPYNGVYQQYMFAYYRDNAGKD